MEGLKNVPDDILREIFEGDLDNIHAAKILFPAVCRALDEDVHPISVASVLAYVISYISIECVQETPKGLETGTSTRDLITRLSDDMLEMYDRITTERAH